MLGPTVERELFGSSGALGAWVRAAGWRLRVVGVMESKGQMLGFDIDDAVYVPVATALAIAQEDSFLTEFLFQHLVFRAQILDRPVLISIDPTSKD